LRDRWVAHGSLWRKANAEQKSGCSSLSSRLTDAAFAGSRSGLGRLSALQALLAGATLADKSDGKDRASGHAGR
jgi:hypothetical protein